MSKILKLTAEHFKRINFVEIEPDGSLVVLSGKNGQGKSSVLDSIQSALEGAAAIPSKAITKGYEKGSIEIDLGDVVVRRTFTQAGGSLVVTPKEKDAKALNKPQAVLDAMIGKLAFDPLEFVSPPGCTTDDARSRRRSEILKGMLGLDFSEKEKERQKHYDERTVANRELANLVGSLKAYPFHPDAPKEEQSASKLMEEQSHAQQLNSENAAKRQAVASLKTRSLALTDAIKQDTAAIEDTEEELKRINERLELRKRSLATRLQEREKLRLAIQEDEAEVSKLVDKDLSVFSGKLSEVEKLNAKVRDNSKHNETKKAVEAKRKVADGLTRKIDTIDAEKRKAVLEAHYPVEGLSLSDAGEVLVNGLPFDQASTREQLIISVSIAIALNPKLRVILVRAGNDLDSDGLKLIAEIAKKNDVQIWLEKIDAGGLPTVIIEDGYVAGTQEEEPEDRVPDEGALRAEREALGHDKPEKE